MLNSKEADAIHFIRNSLVHKGRFPSMRELMFELKYKSPRSASVIIDQLIEKGYLSKKSNGLLQLIKDLEEQEGRAQTVDVPLLGVVSCGLPILAEENIDAIIQVSVKLASPPHKYFLLKASGDSMNKKGINSGDLVLIRLQQTANNGDCVVALIDDETTIKEYRRTSTSVVLIPHSTDPKYQPIVLTNDFKVQGVVVTTIPKI